MQLKQLITSARQYLHDNGYTESTIYHNYVWHWNTFLKSVGDSEYSYDLMEGYATNRFGRDIFQSAVSGMGRDEYRSYHALLALNFFHDEGAMPGTSMSGAAIRQPLTEASHKAFQLYMDSLEQLEYALCAVMVVQGKNTADVKRIRRHNCLCGRFRVLF